MMASLASRLRQQARELLELADLLEPSSIDPVVVASVDKLSAQKDALTEAIYSAGGVRRLADRLGISRQAICQWQRCPAERVLDVENISGVSRCYLRPDLYPLEEGGA